jgi:hypothetical protein
MLFEEIIGLYLNKVWNTEVYISDKIRRSLFTNKVVVNRNFAFIY